MLKRNTVEFMVYGRYALFSDPITRLGGEKFSYLIPTYQALKGMLESIYWKPTIIWYIDEIRVMKRIQSESKGIRPIRYTTAGNDLAYYTYLKDVCYQVRGHFEWNKYRPELAYDQDEHKHHNIAKRMITRGGRRDVFLGSRECQAYVEPCVFGEGKGDYDKYGTLNFGMMFHGFDYPDETGRNELRTRLWPCEMTDGKILFPMPQDFPNERQRYITRFIKPMKAKAFGKEYANFAGLNEPELVSIIAEKGDI